jgi:hypothetical protein
MRQLILFSLIYFNFGSFQLKAQTAEFGEQPNGTITDEQLLRVLPPAKSQYESSEDKPAVSNPVVNNQGVSDVETPEEISNNESENNIENNREPSSVSSQKQSQKRSANSGMSAITTSSSTSSSNFSSSGAINGGNSALVEKVYHAQIKAGNGTFAKKKMIEEAITKTSESLVLDMIGAARYEKSKNEIHNKVFKQTARFIPVMKTSELTKDAEGNFLLAVTMQVSVKALESILKDQGLLYELEATPIILPLITFVDQVQNKSFRWWRTVRDLDQNQQYNYLEKILQKNFSDQGFFVERPNNTGLQLLLPSVFDKDSFTSEDWVSLAQVYKVAALIEGDIRIVTPPSSDSELIGIEVQLLARQISSGKVFAELYRKSQWDKKDFWNQKKVQQWVDSTFKDLALQVKESWQRGSLSSSVLKLIVKGGLPISRFQKFKDQIQSQSRSIRQIRERVISSDELIFDIDVTDNSGDLSGQLQTVVFDDQKFQLMASNSGSITLVKSPK